MVLAAGQRVTWSMRHASIRYWATVDANGVAKIEHRVKDVLDLTPGVFPGIKGAIYDAFAIVAGSYYRGNGGGYPGGNRNMQTQAEWTTTWGITT